MSSQVHLVRHAESVHNVTKDFSLLDPPLTLLGHKQAAELVHTFPHASSVGIILVSPLRRAIETTLSAFPHVLDREYFEPGSGLGIAGGAKLVLDADLQERSALPCDTGSANDVLKRDFPRLDFSGLGVGWQIKDGFYAAEDAAVEERARRVRGRLRELSQGLEESRRNHVVVVTHGVFMKFLSGETDIDLPKAGWKTYTVGQDDSHNAILLPL
jgi:broad specificity phosphatase PhoE